MSANVGKTRVVWRLCGVHVLVCLLAQNASSAARDTLPPAGPEDRTGYASTSEAQTLRCGEDALSRAFEILGLAERKGLKHSVEQVTLEKDNTPYLSDGLVGRPLWHVVVEGWSVEPLDSSPPGAKDWYTRILDVFLDPTNGQVLKIKSRWPENMPDLFPEPSAASGAEQMYGSGKEIYHAFPSEPPGISFAEAVRALQRGGGNPRAAKQIIGQWVVWSRMDGQPRPMWAITLRGIPPVEPGVPAYFQDHMRYMVDPVEKRWVIGTVQPQPDVRPDKPQEEK